MIDKSDAVGILERNIDFVRNCDNKASIFLGIFGVILTLVFTTDGIDNLEMFISSACEDIMFCNIIYLLFMAVSVLCMLYGTSRIIKVLGVQISKNKYVKENGIDLDSKIFFDHISKNANYLIYREKLLRAYP
jgi:hypothetical protein